MDLLENMTKYLFDCKYRKKLSNHTVKAYKIDLIQFIQEVGEREIEKEEMEQYIVELHKRFKEKTVKRKIASIKAFYRYLDEMNMLKYGNPFYKIKVQFKEQVTLPKIIPRYYIEQLLNYMYQCKQKKKEDRNIIRNLCIVEMLFATGMRVGELSNLRKEDVDLKTGMIDIFGKGEKERKIQIVDPSILKLMNEYNVNLERNRRFFFLNERGVKLSEQTVRLMLRKYSYQSGIPIRITPHMFRHSFATYLIEEGVDISCLRALLGHSSIKTTQIYISVAVKVQSDILRKKHPRNRMNILCD